MAALAIAVVAAIAAVGSTIFTGISLRMLASQTKSLRSQVQLQIQQTDSLARQTELQTGQYEILASATELQFNLDVMIRLQDVLFNIADDETSRNEVWGDRPDSRRPQMAADALLDVVEMALKACERLPHFASNLDDWKSYTEYVITNSPSLRARALSNPAWWPEITPYAEKAQALPSPSGHDDGVISSPQIKAAKTIVDYDKATGRKTSEAVRRAARATPPISNDPPASEAVNRAGGIGSASD